jgi:hypothetical protein
MVKDRTITYACILIVCIHFAVNLYESHMASYGLTDIEDVGILIQNNQETINGLEKERENVKMRDGRERGRGERERENRGEMGV